jgi:hypothetical protein
MFINLIALSTIYHEIESIPDANIRDSMKFVFSSALPQASKMVFVIRRRGRSKGKVEESKPEVGSWATRGYWVPPEYFEINAWNCFEQRYKKVLRGKGETYDLLSDRYREAKKFEELLNNKTILIQTKSALDMQDIPSNSVDYVFTDPPYGDAVPYLELDYMWASWLKFEPDFEEEIIISDSPVRDKKFDEYTRMLTQAFKETFRILKPNHWMTVTFHSTDIQVYNAIIRSVIFAGFELDKIVYQHPARPSAKALLAPYGSAVGDYYIRFKKPKIQRKLPTEKEVDALRFENIVINAVKKIIIERGEPTTYNDILKGIYVELDKHGYLLIAKPENIEKIIKKWEGKEFEFIKGEGWWIKDPSKYWLHITPLQDRVEKFTIQTLRKKFKVSFDEILQELFLKLQNALTPNPPSIKAILEEYAIPTKDKKWKLKAQEDKTRREQEHSKMIGYLMEIGKKLGFDTWVGLKEHGDIYKGEPLSKLSSSRLKLSGIERKNLEEIKMVDALWIKNGRIAFEFEVEYTTSIRDSIIRGSYIPSDGVKRFIVIPKEREKLLFRRIRAPLISNKLKEYRWGFIFFNDLEEFYLYTKRKKQISIIDFEKIGRRLILKRKKQKTILEF